MICFSLNEPFRQEKRRADYSSAPKSRAVPLEREVAREELCRAVGHSDDRPDTICHGYCYRVPALFLVVMTAENVENIVAIDHAHMYDRPRVSDSAISPVYGRSQ